MARIMSELLKAIALGIEGLWKALAALTKFVIGLPWGYISKGIILIIAGVLLIRVTKWIFKGIIAISESITYNNKIRFESKEHITASNAYSNSILPEVRKGISRIKKRVRRHRVLKEKLSFFLGKQFTREIQKIEKRQKFLNTEILYLCKNRPTTPCFVNPEARDFLPGRERTECKSSLIKQEVEKMNQSEKDYQRIIDQYSEEEGVLEVRLENIRRQVKGVEAVIIGQTLTRERITENSSLMEELGRWKKDMQKSLTDLHTSDKELAAI